jgi:glucose uptake protein GlcU
MFVLITSLIAGGSMAFAVHQWWRGHHMMAIAFIAVAWLVAGAAIEAAKNNQKAAAAEHIDEVLRQR